MHPDGSAKQELNQSPLPFLESRFLSNAQQALARKDAIIRVRNAQVGIRAFFRVLTNDAGRVVMFIAAYQGRPC